MASLNGSPGAGVDSAWEQEKPEARKMLENAAESQRQVHPIRMTRHPVSRKKPSSAIAIQSILPIGRSGDRTKQWRRALS
jgi:hypothetical protein